MPTPGRTTASSPADGGGWSHSGTQSGTESTALALLALHSGRIVTKAGVSPLMATQRTDGLWCAVGDEATGNFWATGLAVNTLLTLNAKPASYVHSLEVLVRGCPLEASWLVRLKFRISDRHVQFNPKKYGWPWVPDTLSWVLPTSMALIALQRAKERGLVCGRELAARLRLGIEMLLDRAYPQGGWNAGNAVVYGVPLRPHVAATALAVAALQVHYNLPMVRTSLTWLMRNVECESPHSLAWLILAAYTYKDVSEDIRPAVDKARNRLASLVEDPRTIEDAATLALAALALAAQCHASIVGRQGPRSPMPDARPRTRGIYFLELCGCCPRILTSPEL